MQKQFARRLMIIGVVVVALLGFAAWYLWEKFAPPKPFGKVVTIAGEGAHARILPQKSLSDPFGVVADSSGNIYVTDGLGGSVYKVTLDGKTALITDQLDMPSHLAIAPDGNLIVANTGAHTIVRVNPKNGEVTLIAGTPNVSGNADGTASEAKFHAPVGVAVNKQGVIYVADTYNDRICVIDGNQVVKTLAGSGAQFKSPYGISLSFDEQELVVADTGNNAIRRVGLDGKVAELSPPTEPQSESEVSIAEPLAILVTGAEEMYVVGSASANLIFSKAGKAPAKRPPAIDSFDFPGRYLVAGGKGSGLLDSDLQNARFNRPTGIALVGKNTLIVADSGNGLVRAIVPVNANVGKISDPSAAMIKAEEIRKIVPPRWPYDPPEAPREIAGTLGEVRGEIAPEKDAWFHNGLDIPGAYGEQVRALYNERVTRPLAVEGVGDLRERLRLPLLGYIHVKIARDQDDKPIGIKDAIFTRDEKGKIVSVRIPRGTRINAGDIIGTLNRFNHVHLIAGNAANEVNAIAALTLPGLADTKAPIIEGIRVLGEQGELIAEKNSPLQINGKIKIVVRSYDQTDGVAAYRKLGVYRVGYQILNDKGEPLPDYKEPRFNIEFNRLPDDARAANIAYATPSQSGYTGKTIFDYTVTNIVRDGIAREEWLDTTTLPKGNLRIRSIVEDFFRNRSTREVAIVVH